jgi:predicted nuclease of predicted toxin-antitoxin system
VIELWIDAQLSPAIAAWINDNLEGVQAKSVRSLGLVGAEDSVIFNAAREAGVILVSKERDFVDLLDRHGVPPRLIWITCGNTSNERMRVIFKRTLRPALDLLEGGERLVEIGDVSVWS